MIVAELMAILERHNPEAEVRVYDPDFQDVFPLIEVYRNDYGQVVIL